LFALALAEHPIHVVVFDHDMSVAELQSHIKAVLGDVAPKYVYKHALKGFAAPLSPELKSLAVQHPKFKMIEEDKMAHILDDKACSAQSAPGSWGLVRISQRDMNLAPNNYFYPDSAGSGVTAYILDTGIYVEHNDFGGRAQFGFKAETGWSNTDGNGHGTHVASTVGGTQYGVAKNVNLVAVKVLSDGGSGSYAGVIAGVDWALGDYLVNKATIPGTINMSLGGPIYVPLNDALTYAYQQGLLSVVAAGNDNGDSCNSSPSSARDVITVGATDQSAAVPPGDVRSYFSSFGPCVDVFAPGSDITAAWIGSVDATNTISGTSMASPHVCGVTALVFGTNKALTASEVTSIVVTGTSTKGTIDLMCGGRAVCNQSPNIMVYNGCSAPGSK